MLTIYIEYITTIAGFALQFGIFAFLIRGGQYKTYPLFSVYIGTVAITNLINFILRVTLNFYWNFYFGWACNWVHMLLGLLVLYEVLSSIFEEYEGIRSLGMFLFYISALVLIALGVATAATTKAHGLPVLFASYARVEAAVRVVQCGLVLFLVFFMRTLALQWKRTSLGIAFGFGLYACLELFYLVAMLRLGLVWAPFLNMIQPVGYLTSILVWTVAVMSTVKEKQLLELPQLKSIEQWNDAILEFITR